MLGAIYQGVIYDKIMLIYFERSSVFLKLFDLRFLCDYDIGICILMMVYGHVISDMSPYDMLIQRGYDI